MDRAGDVLQVSESFLFPNAQGLGNLPEIEGTLFQKFGNFFADRRHISMGRRGTQKKRDKYNNKNMVWGATGNGTP